jgi:hypothetical protein
MTRFYLGRKRLMPGRMTQDIALLFNRAADLASDIRNFLSERFQIAVRVRDVKAGSGYRVYQLQKSGK